MTKRVELIRLKNYVCDLGKFEGGRVYSLKDSVANDALSRRTKDGVPIFRQPKADVVEREPEVEATPEPPAKDEPKKADPGGVKITRTKKKKAQAQVEVGDDLSAEAGAEVTTKTIGIDVDNDGTVDAEVEIKV